MVTKFTIFVLILLFPFAGFSQNKIKKAKPNENVKVTKEYDEAGNLIRYDSTYVRTWSSDSTHQFTLDSSFDFSNIREMRKQMQEQFGHFFKRDSSGNESFQQSFFSDDFFDDNIFDSQFFHPDFFSGDSTHNNIREKIKEMMNEQKIFSKEQSQDIHRNIDSLHNDFMKMGKKYFKQRDSID